LSGTILLLAVAPVLGLGALAASVLLLRGTSTLLRGSAERAEAARKQNEAALATLRESFEDLAARVEELERRPGEAGLLPVPKSGLNLSKRSQALRMHRRGETPEQIAAALELPLQEVELLLKVHGIVLRSI
jgi:hypothetical protein